MVRIMSSPGAIAFQIGPVVVRWYGILMATSIVVGLWLGHREARKEGLPADDFISAGQWAILAGLALFAPLLGSATQMFKDNGEIEAALATFLLSASGITIYGVGAPFWGLVVGLVLYGARHLNAMR